VFSVHLLRRTVNYVKFVQFSCGALLLMNYRSFSLLFWNVRGLNNEPDKRCDILSDLISTCPQEKKLTECSGVKTSSFLTSRLNTFSLRSAAGAPSGICLAWDANFRSAIVLDTRAY